MAPCFTLMEEEVYGYLRKSLEWENIDGIMTPGGSFGNFMSIVLARHRAFPETKVEGIQHLPKLKIIASDVSHYSWKKGAIMCSLGTNSVSSVKTN